ncbi:unnamed protein product [Schistocephalus solidus]|uniref:Uncharacterized protein n=1 Tax=Schistocephalus solidus TaxID=70667 RepID=A0A183SP03_SCHSO|nr:unnamed protein product [Schistocephalus solidus]
MLLWSPLNGTQLSPVATRSWAVPSGQTMGNRHDWRTKTGEGLHCCSGRSKAERRDAGAAFAIRNDIVGRLPCLPQGINDHLISLRLPLRGDKFATTFSAYALPNDEL